MSRQTVLIETFVEEWAKIIDERNPRRMIDMLTRFGFAPRLELHLDWENIFYSLKKAGGRLRVEDILDAIKAALSQAGEIVSITAYADWGRMQRECRFDVQRRLVQLGVHTRYVLTRSNASDMAMANNLRDALENDRNNIDAFVIVSGDGDFKPVVDTIKQRGKRVIILACASSLSHSLRQSADQVLCLNDYLKSRRTAPVQPSHIAGRTYAVPYPAG